MYRLPVILAVAFFLFVNSIVVINTQCQIIIKGHLMVCAKCLPAASPTRIQDDFAVAAKMTFKAWLLRRRSG